MKNWKRDHKQCVSRLKYRRAFFWPGYYFICVKNDKPCKEKNCLGMDLIADETHMEQSSRNKM